MITIRVSTLESWRRVMQTPYGDYNEIVAYIRNGQQSEPDWRMRCGTAWHKCLEGKETGETGVVLPPRYYFDGFAFAMEAVIDAQRIIGPGLNEVRNYMRIETALGPVLVTGQCDHIRGLVIQDSKTKCGTKPDVKHYEQSWQWPFYLSLFDAWKFQYNLWQFKEPEQGTSGFVEYKDLYRVSFYRYCGMKEQCYERTRDFVAWANERGFLPFLERAKGIE